MDQEYKTLLAIESSGDLNPVQRTRLEELKRTMGSSGGTGFDQLKRMVDTAINKYQEQMDAYSSKYREFDEKNPFVFDDILAEEKTKVSQRLDPYYDQTLNDFLTGITRKRERGLEDERTLLTELNRDVDQFEGRQRENLEYTLERTGEGFADAGLYGSGKNLRAEGRLRADEQDTVGDFNQRADDRRNRISTDRIRTEEDLTLAEQLQRRDLGREQSYQVNTQALAETGLRQQQREFERGQYTGAAPGVNPMTYQNNLYSLLGA